MVTLHKSQSMLFIGVPFFFLEVFFGHHKWLADVCLGPQRSLGNTWAYEQSKYLQNYDRGIEDLMMTTWTHSFTIS